MLVDRFRVAHKNKPVENPHYNWLNSNPLDLMRSKLKYCAAIVFAQRHLKLYSAFKLVDLQEISCATNISAEYFILGNANNFYKQVTKKLFDEYCGLNTYFCKHLASKNFPNMNFNKNLVLLQFIMQICNQIRICEILRKINFC